MPSNPADHELKQDVHDHLRQFAIGTASVAAFLLGAYGLYLTEHQPLELSRLSSIAYHTLQLFILNGQSVAGPVPWQLHVGRYLALLPAGLALAAGVRHFLPDEWVRAQLWLRKKNRVVICGLGDLGSTLALAGRQRGLHVTAIEKNCPPALRSRMQKKGVLVLEGDASDPALLRAARIWSAEQIIVAAGDDQTNLTILGALAALPASARSPREALCRVMIANPELRHAVTASGFNLRASKHRLNARDLDRHAVAARQALRKTPLDFVRIGPEEATRVRLVVIGFGAAGMALALNAMETGHFANETPQRRLQVVVMDKDRTGLERFLGLHGKNIANVCELSFHPQPESPRRMLDELAQLCQPSGEHRLLTTYAFCADGAESDAVNFTRGMELQDALHECEAQILVRQSTAKGTAALLANCPAGTGGACRVRAFGMSEEVYSWQNLLREQDDLIAKAIHTSYALKNHDKPWDEQSDGMQESNRYAAEHIAVKLRAVGCEIAPLTPEKTAADFSGSEVELMAQMEHHRWCAERYLDGWETADVKDKQKKLNPSLVPWDKLGPEEKAKDLDQIRALHETLRAAKLGIYRAY